jgi:hypothetical protein
MICLFIWTLSSWIEHGFEVGQQIAIDQPGVARMLYDDYCLEASFVEQNSYLCLGLNSK